MVIRAYKYLRWRLWYAKCQIRDAINGIWSGIPLCCIWHFIRSPHADVAFRDAQRRGHWHDDAEYCQCDRCYRDKRIVKVRDNGYLL